jgi:indole-3-glycerol phosphate synthase
VKALEPTHVLRKIVEAKRRRVSDLQKRVPEPIVRKMASVAPEVRSFRRVFDSPNHTHVIAEVKKASPSAGVLIDPLDVDGLASSYANAGAAALSVVTEEDFFEGNLGWVQRAGRAAGLPVLRKDFVFDEYQVFETRASGASAILLIVAMLEPAELTGLLSVAEACGLDAVVEVHDEAELDEALAAGSRIVGVNNRDLKTFEVRLETSERLGALIPDGVVFIAESGIRTRSDVERLAAAGARGFLVGERLLRASDPAEALRELL